MDVPCVPGRWPACGSQAFNTIPIIPIKPHAGCPPSFRTAIETSIGFHLRGVQVTLSAAKISSRVGAVHKKARPGQPSREANTGLCGGPGETDCRSKEHRPDLVKSIQVKNEPVAQKGKSRMKNIETSPSAHALTK